MVVSWPPCWVPVLANTLPTLPTSAPFIQRPPVWSRKLRICAHMLPKRVGVPRMMPSSFASATVAMGGLVQLHPRLLGDLFRHQLGNTLDRDLSIRHRESSFGDRLRHLLDVAIGAIVEHQNL